MIVLKVSFIPNPCSSHLWKISKIEATFDLLWFFIYDFSFPVKFSLRPIPFIGQVSRLIEKFTESLYFSFLPRPFIRASIFVIQFSKTVSQTMKRISFIPASTFVLLNNKPLFFIIGYAVFLFYLEIRNLLRTIFNIWNFYLIVCRLFVLFSYLHNCWISLIHKFYDTFNFLFFSCVERTLKFQKILSDLIHFLV